MRSYAAAVAYARGQHNNPSLYVRQGNHCQQFVRSCVGASAWAPSAIAAWHAIPAAHRHSGAPRAGSVAYFDRPGIPDHREFGHTVFVVEKGMTWSTDALRYGHVDLVPYTWFAAHWNMRYLGWIDWTPSGKLNLAPVPLPPTYAYRQGKKVYRSKMRLGQMNSDSVWNVTLALRAKYARTEIPIDDYTADVEHDVAVFQRSKGWTGTNADGIVGPGTCKALGLIWVAD